MNDLSKEVIALEDSVAHAAGEDIQIDEAGSTVLKEALRRATECKITIKNLDPMSAKESALPLQGKNFWLVWAQLDKKQHEEMKSDIAILEVRKNALRRSQNKAAEHISPLMATFLSQILSTPRNIRVYYLQYLKLYFDDYSRTHLRKLAQRYEADLAQTPTRKHPEIRQNYYKQLSTASLGLEHVFCEVSQVYEAAASQSLKYSDRLPRVAAELLIDGYPLELLDGDTGHVPLTWVKAVLDEVITLLNDPNVFVLSVLGLQSSGKSTLLNSTFGLKFAVSAGRCTRGAYMQLLPLDEKLQEELKCDYLLVVDTEGLRAPKLESRQRIKSDNKLATFAVGLANVTLINIFGEVPGDIDDILQTLIHAFIRMRRVKLKASCQFVHQNVSSTSTLLKGKMGRTLFRDKLDSVTKDIAQAEGCGQSFTCFNDVISYDMEEDVHYFPGLWNGVLPMATVSQGYCDKARVLRKRIIGLMKNKENPLSSFRRRLKDLWKALLHDDFVLSFKNSLEAIAFKFLEAEYGKWSWEFKDAILTWSEESNTQVSNCEPEELSDLSSRLISELNELADGVHCDLEKKMHAFFKTSKHADLLQPHKRSKMEQLSLLKNSTVSNAKNQCRQAVEVKKANLDISGIRNKYDTKIRDES